jgi:hypothetical protein
LTSAPWQKRDLDAVWQATDIGLGLDTHETVVNDVDYLVRPVNLGLRRQSAVNGEDTQ